MTEQTPEPVADADIEIDESAVEPEHTTNVVDAHDDVEIAESQLDVADPGVYEDDEDADGAE